MLKLNGEPVDVTIFPDGTSQVWKLENHISYDMVNRVEWWYEREVELLHLLQLLSYLPRVDLYIPYLPYARQDKPFDMGSTWSLSILADLLNKEALNSVHFFDAHSRVAFQKIDRSIDHPPDLSFARDYDIVIFPDKGAGLRYDRLVSLVAPNVPRFSADKVRDQETGWITGYSLPDECVVQGKRVIVIDDLCDGGKTFEILGGELYNRDALESHLYVSHGVFSKGIGTLLNSYSKIITTDSYVKYNHPEGSKVGREIRNATNRGWFELKPVKF